MYSLYIHIPFCTSKCTYCAFNTYINLENLIPRFVEALCHEISLVGDGQPVHTIFFGGGTPSLLTPEQFNAILHQIQIAFDVKTDAEITSEANPNDLDTTYLEALHNQGINRLSIGMQSAQIHTLKFFARRHTHQGVIKAVYAARQAGFDNINLDLIYGIPYQTMEDWQQSVRAAIALDVEHLSLYALGLEQGTPLDDWVQRGTVPEPDDDLAADMYEWVSQALDDAGYKQYEISNWARAGRACQHNIQYWRNQPYLGFGPGAHGFADGIRYEVRRSPVDYVHALLDNPDESTSVFPLSPAVGTHQRLSQQEEISETLITNLRLLADGIDRQVFKDRFQIDLLDYHPMLFERFAEQDLVSISTQAVRLTAKGRLLSNVIFRELV
jgi:oxygen-independent coproporphyrinogen III oxidase